MALSLKTRLAVSWAVGIATALLSSFSGNAQQTVSGPPVPSVLSHSLAAMIPGGTPLQDITLQGSVEYTAGSTDVSGTITLKATSDGSSRVDLALPSGVRSESIVVANSQFKGQRSGANGTVVPMALHNLLIDPAWFSPAMLVQHLSSTSWDTATLGIVQRGTSSVEQITTSRHVSSGDATVDEKLRRASEMDLLIDTSTSLPLFLTFHLHPDNSARGDGYAVAVVYADYQTLGGLVVPTHVQKYVNRVLSLDIHITSAVINSGVVTSQLALQ